MKGTHVTSHFKGQLYSWGVFKKKKKEKKSSLFKKYAFSVDLVSLLPALETQKWLLLIWPKWSYYPGVKESGSWLTVMLPPRGPSLHFALTQQCSQMSGMIFGLVMWFLSKFQHSGLCLGQKLHMCSGSVSGFTLSGQMNWKKTAESLICLLSKSAFPESRDRCSHPKYLKAMPCILSINRIAYVRQDISPPQHWLIGLESPFGLLT